MLKLLMDGGRCGNSWQDVGLRPLSVQLMVGSLQLEWLVKSGGICVAVY